MLGDNVDSSVRPIKKQEYSKTESTAEPVPVDVGGSKFCCGGHVSKDACPVGGKRCSKCSKENHFAIMSQSSGTHKRKLTHTTEKHHSDKDVVFNVTEISAVDDSQLVNLKYIVQIIM